eukprot:6485322-Lingulodinium_polyedra.AAC.1
MECVSREMRGAATSECTAPARELLGNAVRNPFAHRGAAHFAIHALHASDSRAPCVDRHMGGHR